MAERNIVIAIQAGAAMYLPHPVKANPGDMVAWSVQSGIDGWVFQSPGGVTIATSGVPPGYTPWPDPQPIPGPDGTYFVASMPAVGPEGATYRYTFTLFNTETQATFRWDPDLENHPGG
jgi:hypothetical protein